MVSTSLISLSLVLRLFAEANILLLLWNPAAVCCVLTIFFLLVQSFTTLDVYVTSWQNALSAHLHEEPIEKTVKELVEFNPLCGMSLVWFPPCYACPHHFCLLYFVVFTKLAILLQRLPVLLHIGLGLCFHFYQNLCYTRPGIILRNQHGWPHLQASFQFLCLWYNSETAWAPSSVKSLNPALPALTPSHNPIPCMPSPQDVTPAEK